MYGIWNDACIWPAEEEALLPEVGHDVSESDSVDRPDESRVIGEWNALQYSCA